MIQNQKGFIALISTIIISVLLITITVVIGMNSFFTRFNILDSESKERSLALAEGCIDKAMFNLIEDPSYNPSNEVVPIGSDSCTIVSVQTDVPSVGETTIKTQSVFNKSYSTLKVIIDSVTNKINLWQECANLGGTC